MNGSALATKPSSPIGKDSTCLLFGGLWQATMATAVAGQISVLDSLQTAGSHRLDRKQRTIAMILLKTTSMPASQRCRRSGFANVFGLCVLIATVSPLAAVNLDVSVLSAVNQRPLTNATVTVREGKKVLSSSGPAASPIRIEVIGSLPSVEVTASAPGYSPVRASVRLGGNAEARQRFLLPKAQTVGGRVVEEETSRPIAGARVFLNFPRKLLGPAIPVDDVPIVTGADGRWQCNWLPADVPMVRVQVRRSGYEVVPQSAPSLAELRAGTATVMLRPLLLLRGVVLDPLGRPVAGAFVVYGSQYVLYGVEENKSTHTDARGRFRFAGIEPGQLALGAYSEAFAPVAQVVDVRPNLPPITLRMGVPHTVSARVVDERGQPVPDVHVAWDEAGIFRYPGWQGLTDADGRFQITNAPKEQISVDVNRAGFMDMAFIRLQPGLTNQTIILPPVMRFRGKVLAGNTEQPVPEFKVMPGVFRSFPGQEDSFGGSPYQSKDFSDGHLDLKLTLPPGGPGPLRIGLRISANGFQTATVGPFSNSVDNLVIRLRRAVLRSVQFLTPAGKPAAGAQVQIARDFYYLRARSGRFPASAGPGQEGLHGMTADTNGVVILPDDPDAKFGLAVHAGGYLLFAPANRAPRTVLHLIPWATVEGTLRLRGKPLTHQEMALMVPSMPQHSGTNTVWFSNPLGDQQTTTDAEGRFRFDRVPPGDIGVAWAQRNRPAPGMGYAFGHPQYSGLLDTIHLTAGQHAKLELNETGTDVTGRIVLPPDAPPGYDWRYARIALWRPAPELAVPTNLTGTARSHWLRDWFYSEKGRPYRAWLFVGLGIVGRDGKPYPASRSVPIQADGTFTFRALPPGQFNLRILLERPPSSEGRGSMPWESAWLRFVVPEDAGAHFHLGDVGWTNSYSYVPAPRPSEREPFTVGISVGAGSLTPYTFAPLRVRIRVAPGYHIYARDESSKTYAPLSLKLTLPKGWKEWGDWTGPAGQLQDGHLVLSGDLLFRRQLVVAAKLPDRVRFVCEVRAQACNDQLCWPPKTKRAETTVTP